MARIVTRSNGLREIRFDDKNGNPRTIYVGRMPKRDAEAVGTKIDHIVGRQITGSEPDHTGQSVDRRTTRCATRQVGQVRFGIAKDRRSRTVGSRCADHQGVDRSVHRRSERQTRDEGTTGNLRTFTVQALRRWQVDRFVHGW